jgi:hypothetical protein
MKILDTINITIRVITLFIIIANIIFGIHNKNVSAICGWFVAFLYGIDYLIFRYLRN